MRPKRPIAHAFNGDSTKVGSTCRERVTHKIGDLTIWVACGWPRYVHPKRKRAAA